jgi:hypothetical protein
MSSAPKVQKAPKARSANSPHKTQKRHISNTSSTSHSHHGQSKQTGPQSTQMNHKHTSAASVAAVPSALPPLTQNPQSTPKQTPIRTSSPTRAIPSFDLASSVPKPIQPHQPQQQQQPQQQTSAQTQYATPLKTAFTPSPSFPSRPLSAINSQQMQPLHLTSAARMQPLTPLSKPRATPNTDSNNIGAPSALSFLNMTPLSSKPTLKAPTTPSSANPYQSQQHSFRKDAEAQLRQQLTKATSGPSLKKTTASAPAQGLTAQTRRNFGTHLRENNDDAQMPNTTSPIIIADSNHEVDTQDVNTSTPALQHGYLTSPIF